MMISHFARSLYSWLRSGGKETEEEEEEDDDDRMEELKREIQRYEEMEPRKDVECQVTGLNRLENYAILNGDYLLDLAICPGILLSVGDIVLVDLELNGKVWNATSLRRLELEEPDNNNTHTGRITNIADGIATINGNITVQLEAVQNPEQELRYITGDWIKITYENDQPVSIRPLRRLPGTTGTITSIKDLEGTINNEIWFHLWNVSHNGYRPSLGDEVVFEAIESSQGPLEWRALSLILKSAGPRQYNRTQTSRGFGLILTKQHRELLSSKQGIQIKKCLSFDTMAREETKTISCFIINEGQESQDLVSIEQDAPLDPDMFEVKPPFKSFPHTLEPGARIDLKLTCHAKKLGRCQQLIIFNFGQFKMGRFVKVEVDDPSLSFLLKGSPYQKRVVSLERLNICDRVANVVPGIRRKFNRGGRNTQSNYVKMGIYPVPPVLYQQIVEKKDLLHLYPILGEMISPKNYTQKFDMLLHLEEIQLCIDLQQYNMRQACLQHSGPYLTLEVPGLSEGRPSLLIGDRALLTVPGESDLRNMTVYEGCIHEIHRDSILLMFEPDFHAKYNGESYDISFEFNRNQIRKCHYTIAHVGQLKHLLFPPLSRELHDPVFKPCEWFNECLNDRQKDAVVRILENRAIPSPYVVFGPPGTGKTLTLVEAVLHIVNAMPYSRLLVCAPSNSAADLIALKIVKAKGFDPSDLVRLNAFQRKEESILEGLAPHCQIGKDLSLVSRRRVIVATCTNAGLLFRLQLSSSHFTHILIDEAGQATEPETLIPVLLAPNAQVVLAGDHKQLGPIVRSFVARNSGLQLSLMERIMSRQLYQPDPELFADTGNYNPHLVTKLVDNYRSVPDLVAMPSKMFYDNQLVCHYNGGKEFQKLSQSKIFPTPGFPIVFHGVMGEELRESDSPSWFNPAEILQVSQYLSDLYAEDLEADNVGIITPYRKQVEKLRMYIKALGMPLCKVGSVEEFQGQERKAIIVSTVRTQTQTLTFEQNIGFLSQPKRFNVTVTRSKQALIIVGDPRLLSKDEHWGTFLQHVIEHGGYRGCQMSSAFAKDEKEDQ